LPDDIADMMEATINSEKDSAFAFIGFDEEKARK